MAGDDPARPHALDDRARVVGTRLATDGAKTEDVGALTLQRRLDIVGGIDVQDAQTRHFHRPVQHQPMAQGMQARRPGGRLADVAGKGDAAKDPSMPRRQAAHTPKTTGDVLVTTRGEHL